MSAALPVGFADQVGAARDELAEMLPRLLAIVDWYPGMVDNFNALVPPDGTNDWLVPWEECGADEINEQLVELSARIRETVHGADYPER